MRPNALKCRRGSVSCTLASARARARLLRAHCFNTQYLSKDNNRCNQFLFFFTLARRKSRTKPANGAEHEKRNGATTTNAGAETAAAAEASPSPTSRYHRSRSLAASEIERLRAFKSPASIDGDARDRSSDAAAAAAATAAATVAAADVVAALDNSDGDGGSDGGDGGGGRRRSPPARTRVINGRRHFIVVQPVCSAKMLHARATSLA